MIAIPIKSKVYGEKLIFIDGEDFEKIKSFNWHLRLDKKTNSYYVQSFIKKNKPYKKISIHRLIMDCPDNKIVDHINHNTLDNRKENLRICTNSQNVKNCIKHRKNLTSKYKGVSKTESGNFKAQININGKRTCIGTFKTEIEAAIFYNKKAIECYGEFANLNEVKP